MVTGCSVRSCCTAIQSLAKLLCGTPNPDRSSHSALPVHDFSNRKSLNVNEAWPGNPPLTSHPHSLSSLALTLFQVNTYMANTLSLSYALSTSLSFTKSHTPPCTHMADQGSRAGRSLTSLGTMAASQGRVSRRMSKENRWGSMMDWSAEPPGGDLRDPPPPSCRMLSQ